MQSAASDLSLLEAAARDAADLCRTLLQEPLEVQWKGHGNPVTNIDFAVDALLTERLRSARPDYGWLSEEAPDNREARLGKHRVFMLDPIDGTGALVEGKAEFTICIGIIEDGKPLAGAIVNPRTNELFLGARGLGATKNGAPIKASATDAVEGARVVGKQGFYKRGLRWPKPWPEMRYAPLQSIAYRLAKVAGGEADFVFLNGPKNEWDIAAGAAIVEAAGGRFTDAWGGAVAFNQPTPRTPGSCAAAGASLHPLIIERTSLLPRPKPT